MYEEMVKSLRCYAKDEECYHCGYFSEACCDIDRMLFDAADAIEELSRIEHDFRNYISDQVNRTKGVYACCFCKNRESASRYEPGCKMEECDGVSGWEYGTPKEGDA